MTKYVDMIGKLFGFDLNLVEFQHNRRIRVPRISKFILFTLFLQSMPHFYQEKRSPVNLKSYFLFKLTPERELLFR